MKLDRTSLPLLILPSMLFTTATADTHTEIDISNWRCKFCEFEEGFSGSVEIGAGYLSEDAFKFGEYTGLVDEGGFLIANAEARYRDEDADYVDVTAVDLGLDSRSLTAIGGRQGAYRLHLRYDQLPHNVSDSAQTPFAGSGGDDLSLPPGWVEAGTTAGMSELSASLRDVELSTERERLEVGAAFMPAKPWEIGVNFRRDSKEGTQRTAGAFFLTSSQLVAPVDYVTDEVEAFVSYAQNELQVRLAYYGSAFDNENTALSWDNPFTPLVAGADSGELALPPDNEFHQIRLSAGYKISDATRASGELSVGRMEQNEEFLDVTTNPNLSVPALPRDSLDGRVDTLNAALKITSRWSEQWRFNAAYRLDDRDNETPQESYDWVTTDMFLAGTRKNQPYSFTKQALDLSADYRAAPTAKMSFGLDHEDIERDLQEVDDSRENTLWTRLSARPAANVLVEMRLAYAERDVSTYEAVAETQPPQNPLLRKYNMADRTRTSADLRISTSTSDMWQYGVGASTADDHYTDSEVGLTNSRAIGVNGDVSVPLTTNSSMHAFFDYHSTNARQAGSNAFAFADWFGTTKDTVNTAGIGVTHRFEAKPIEVGADYTISESRSDIRVNLTEFPDLKTELHSVRLHAGYDLDSGGIIKGEYRYESYDADDWALDDVDPDTIPNVVTLGEESASYDVHVFMLSTRWEFE